MRDCPYISHNCKPYRCDVTDSISFDESTLSAREKWLMEKAYEHGASHPNTYFPEWLNQHAADGVTVEMVLIKEAPNTSEGQQ